jgi:hypothetical protein
MIRHKLGVELKKLSNESTGPSITSVGVRDLDSSGAQPSTDLATRLREVMKFLIPRAGDSIRFITPRVEDLHQIIIDDAVVLGYCVIGFPSEMGGRLSRYRVKFVAGKMCISLLEHETLVELERDAPTCDVINLENRLMEDMTCQHPSRVSLFLKHDDHATATFHLDDRTVLECNGYLPYIGELGGDETSLDICLRCGAVIGWKPICDEDVKSIGE